MVLIKIILIITFGIIFYQDVKERQVYWFLFPVVALCVAFLFFMETLPELFLTSILLNFFFVFILLAIVFLYARYKLKTKFYNTIGLGDVLLFIALIFTCATISFIIILPAALIFSLLLHLFISKNRSNTTVPLAGYISVFFGITFLSFWFGFINSIYQI